MNEFLFRLNFLFNYFKFLFNFLLHFLSLIISKYAIKYLLRLHLVDVREQVDVRKLHLLALSLTRGACRPHLSCRLQVSNRFVVIQIRFGVAFVDELV